MHNLFHLYYQYAKIKKLNFYDKNNCKKKYKEKLFNMFLFNFSIIKSLSQNYY